ncbi:MAG: hypothetical protein WA945_04295 [Arcobacteraceae bacterium]
MRKLKKPSLEYSITTSLYLDEVIEKREDGDFKDFLLLNKTEWVEESKSYNTVLNSSAILDTTSLLDFTTYKDNFAYLYNKASNERSFIPKLRTKYKTSLCPYCSSPSCGTLDHYYPQKKFPQYAIIPNNLIPSCHRCNKIKGEIFPLLNDERIINPYFDDFLDNIIFDLYFYLDNNVLKFDLLPNHNLTTHQYNIVEFHIEKLNLKEFHTDSILLEFDKIKELVGLLKDDGKSNDEILYMLNKLVLSGLQKQKTYDWGIIIMNSIIAHPANFNIL